MGEILDSDWSRQNLLRSDWLGPSVALYTTQEIKRKGDILTQYCVRFALYFFHVCSKFHCKTRNDHVVLLTISSK